MARLIDANALSKKAKNQPSTQCTLLARATVGSASTGKNPMTIAKSLRQSAIKVIFAATASAGRTDMERLTEEVYGKYIRIKGTKSLYERYERDGAPLSNAIVRLAAYEETGLKPEAVEHLKLASMGKAIAKIKEFEGVPVNRLRELAQAYRLLGNTVYEPNKRGVISTYKVISVHFSGCSILVGWDLLDGIYSNLNGFEISALGKTVFLTREAAEAALDAMGGENNA